MDIQHKELSLKFYSFLCDVIGTKQVVNKRRQIFAVGDSCGQVYGEMTLNSGSKAEGLDLKGSDYDVMSVLGFAQVFEQLNHVKNSYDKLSLIIDTENVKPGFTKFWVQHQPIAIDSIFTNCIDRRTERPYFSSTLFRQRVCDTILKFFDAGAYIHGPCTTSPDGMYDNAFSLYCTDWISQAQPWITRTKYSWASDEVIQNILCAGVLFVPIGSKHSPTSDLEWRISFSYAEKLLIFCFNHVQLLCYALLKIILKDIAKKNFGDLLCSYFMKTIVFWLCDETDVAFWKKENLLLCFMTCFRRLIYCVENQTCLHYFIPENNLFENRFERQHNELLSKLHGLHDLGWTFLLHTETLQSFSGYLKPPFMSNITLSTFFPCLWCLNGAHYNFFDDAALFKKIIFQSLRFKKKVDLYMYSLSRMCQGFAQKKYDDELMPGNNKKLYRNLRRSLSNLLIGVNHDAVSGWLLLASFFFTNKQYNISKILIDYSMSKLTPDRCETSEENSLWQLRRYNEIQDIMGLKCLKHYTLGTVLIRNDSSIFIDEIKFLAKNKSYIPLPSIIYAHILNCMYYANVGNNREIVTSYRNFEFNLKRYNLHTKSGLKMRHGLPIFNCAS